MERDESWARHKYALALGALALGALAVRLVYVLVIKHGDPLVADEPYWHTQADYLAKGLGFVDPAGRAAATRPPLGSVVLAVPSKLASGDSILEQRLALAVLGVLTVVVIGFLAREVAGARAGLLAAAIAAVYPALWGYDGVLYAESVAALLVGGAVWLTYRYLRAPQVRWLVALTVACGLATLARGELALLSVALVLPAILVAGTPPRSEWLNRLAIVATATLVVLGPWTAYNLSRFEKPVFISVSWAGSLCGANNDRSYYESEQLGMWGRGCPPVPRRLVATGDYSVVADFWTNRALDYMGGHLTRLPVVMAARFGRVWGVFGVASTVDFTASEGIPSDVVWAGYGAYLALLPLAFWGAVALRRRRVRLFPLLAPIVVVAVTTIFLFGIYRFRVPADVALVVLGGVGIDVVWRALTARRQKARASASSR